MSGSETSGLSRAGSGLGFRKPHIFKYGQDPTLIPTTRNQLGTWRTAGANTQSAPAAYILNEVSAPRVILEGVYASF